MSNLSEIRDSNPFLVTQNVGGYLLHHAELSTISGSSRLSKDAHSYLEQNKIPFIDYTSSSWREYSAAAGYPGPSPLIYPGPYSAMDLAPVELVASLAARDGFTVRNISVLEVPKTILRPPTSAPARRIHNISNSVLPVMQNESLQGLEAMHGWAEQLQGSVQAFILSGDKSDVALVQNARHKHRVFGVLFYNLNMASTNDMPYEKVWGRVVGGLKKWSEHLTQISIGYPSNGKEEIAIAHKTNAALMAGSIAVAERKMQLGFPSSSPAR